jgi:hypothetical protein
VSDWAVVFLGVIAFATLVAALAQVAVLVTAGRLTRRIERVADDVHRDLKPLFEHLDAVGRDAARATALGVAQVERADRVLADLSDRLDQTMNTVQNAASSGAREGAAVMAAFRAAMSALRDFRTSRSRSRADDDDALFI